MSVDDVDVEVIVIVVLWGWVFGVYVVDDMEGYGVG